ncbi:universal stress protein [Mucilaginibacter rigui]|uniref:Universal stress protein n=1 Tax=Mucilaginibacter rigui TaxID=534635 RepID=A0ABR7XAF9_9SPHI|nr:universal stress protein [Mucilaginibacter rigui]MBD1386595.1 universal stress protein [Mucilaginibacter rigui]
MKQILVLTDFSDNAEHAAKNAVQLSKKLHTGLLLYHAYEMMAIDPYYASLPYSPPLYASEGEEQLKLLTETLKKNDAEPEADSPVNIQCMIGEGDLGKNVKEIINEKNIAFVVMGSSSGSAFDHLLEGQETLKVINKSSLPVLIIPSHTDLKEVKKVVFATNYEKNDINALTCLADLARTIGFTIDIIHIDVYKSKEPDLLSEIVFKRYVNGLNFNGISYHDIKGKDVVTRLNSFCKTSGADILAMVHYHQDFFSQLFGASNAKKELAHQQKALFIFPPNFISE